MAGQSSKRPAPYSHPLQDVSPELFQHSHVWAKLAVYRPLLILVGIWVVLLSIAVTAYEHLLYTQADAPQEQSSDITVYPHQRLAQQRPQSPSSPSPPQEEPPPQPRSPEDTVADTPAETAVETSSGSNAAISPWSLGAFVIICALGCSLLSRQLQAPLRPRTKSLKRPTKARHRPPRPSQPPRRTAATPTRLAPYDPSHPLMASSSQTPVSSPRQAPPQTPDAAANIANVTVVPDDTQHPLDWPDDSLVNTVDMRHRRSLSSFL